MALPRRIFVVATLLATISAVNACDGLKKVKDACSVTIAPRDITVPVNSSVQVIGTAFDCDGNSIPKKTVNFSPGNSAIASVTTTGVVLGLTVGTTTVSASASGKSAQATVTVTPERVGSVEVTPATRTLRRGNALQLLALSKNSQGVVIPGINFTWQSSNSSLASVSSSGMVLALAPGSVSITASADGQTGTSLLTITEVPIGSCSLTPATQKVTVGNQFAPTLVLRDTSGTPLSNNGRGISWTSDNNLVATVNPSGVVTAVKAGTTRIIATDQLNPATSCNTAVEVVDARIAFVNITPVAANLRLGVQRQYNVAILDSNRAPLSVSGRSITWRAVTPSVATVSASGIVTPISINNTGRVAVDAEGAVDTATFQVTAIPVVKVEVSPPQRTVVEGQTAQFTAVVTDSANNVVANRPIDWLSSDITKGMVSTTGLVTTSAPGQITITAQVEGRSASGTLIITQVPVDTILIQQPTFSMTKGTNGAVSIDLRDASNRQLRNRTVVVSSDAPSIATGSANTAATQVNVSGIAVGTATLIIQAVNSNGQNEGKPSKVVVTVSN